MSLKVVDLVRRALGRLAQGEPPAAQASQRCPPLRSLGVRSVASSRRRWPRDHVAEQRGSTTAPRLSALATKARWYPASSSRASRPEVPRARKRSPWPGGHHASSGSVGTPPAARVSASRRGVWCWRKRQRDAARAEVGETGERLQAVGLGSEAVHQHQRHRVTCPGGQGLHLAGDHVEEGQGAADRQQRFGAVETHAGAEAAVELDQHRPRQREFAGCPERLEVVARREGEDWRDRVARQEAVVPPGNPFQVEEEGADRGLRLATSAHGGGGRLGGGAEGCGVGHGGDLPIEARRAP